jgi:hypothetical protein
MNKIAFWQYDQFPFVLSGTVIKTHPSNSLVETKEYGIGFAFMPLLVVGEARGKEIQAELKALGNEYHTGLQDFNARMMRKLKRRISPALLKHVK